VIEDDYTNAEMWNQHAGWCEAQDGRGTSAEALRFADGEVGPVEFPRSVPELKAWIAFAFDAGRQWERITNEETS
jgi:hypothetical protein